MDGVTIAIVAILAVGIILGAVAGFVRQFIRLLALPAAIAATFFLHGYLGNKIFNFPELAETPKFISYLVVFIFCFIVLLLLAFIVTKAVKKSPLSSTDRLLGGLFGLVKGYLLCAALLIGVVAYPVEPPSMWVADSIGARIVLRTATLASAAIPNEYSRKLAAFLEEKAPEETREETPED